MGEERKGEVGRVVVVEMYINYKITTASHFIISLMNTLKLKLFET